MKIAQLGYPRFDGLVCYTGLARTSISSTTDTVDRIVEWLDVTRDMRLFQVVEVIEECASSYVLEVERATRKRERLSIVVAAFVDGKPRAAIVSNFEDSLGETSHAPRPAMSTSWVSHKAGDPPRILITGNKRTVSVADQNGLLEEVVVAGEDSGRIRAAIHALNRSASRHPNSKETISLECSVASMDSSGSGQQDVNSIEGVHVKNVRNGSRFSLGEVLNQIGLGSARLVGSSFATNKASSRKPIECKRETWNVGDSEFSMTEILHVIDLDCSPLGLSSRGVVLGMHSEPTDRSLQRYWTWSEETPDELQYLNLEPTANAGGCMNAHGAFIVMCGSHENQAGLVYHGGVYSHSIEISSGMGEPSVAAMNEHGAACGSISINRDDTDGDRSRPAYWRSDGELKVLRELPAGTNGRAVAVNSDGVVLVWASYGLFGRATLLWDSVSDVVQQIAGQIIPIGLTDAGVVLGFDRNDDRDVAIVSYDREVWSAPQFNNGFSPANIAEDLTICGSVQMDGYNSAWIGNTSGEYPIILPTYRYHNANPRFASSEFRIVGQLSTDSDQHVVLWSSSG